MYVARNKNNELVSFEEKPHRNYFAEKWSLLIDEDDEYFGDIITTNKIINITWTDEPIEMFEI